MKAQSPIRASNELGLSSDGFRISKAPVSESEMQECFSKLKDLVPTIPHDRKISKVALMQHVIDYILDLELTLAHDPSLLQPQAQLLQAALQGERKPLAETSLLNTSYQTSSLETKSESCTSATC